MLQIFKHHQSYTEERVHLRFHDNTTNSILNVGIVMQDLIWSVCLQSYVRIKLI